MSSLQRAPLAYLGALDLKITGRNPDGVEDSLRPSLDVSPFYYAPMTTFNTSASLATVDDTTSLILRAPTGQAWLVFGASGALALHAGDIIVDELAMNIAYQESANAPGCGFAALPTFQPRTIVGAEVALRTQVQLPKPILVPPGAAITLATTAEVTLASATNAAFVLAVLAYAFPA